MGHGESDYLFMGKDDTRIEGSTARREREVTRYDTIREAPFHSTLCFFARVCYYRGASFLLDCFTMSWGYERCGYVY